MVYVCWALLGTVHMPDHQSLRVSRGPIPVLAGDTDLKIKGSEIPVDPGRLSLLHLQCARGRQGLNGDHIVQPHSKD